VHYYNTRHDDDTLELLRAITPPPRWAVYYVRLFNPHGYRQMFEIGKDHGLCNACPFDAQFHKDHTTQRIWRELAILVDGPVRVLATLTDREEELPAAARRWLHTLHNVAGAAGAPIDRWVAYDGRG